MARLPIPGGDESSWGTVLNDFLIQSHNTDGTLKTGGVSASQLSTNNSPGSGSVLTHNGSTMTWSAPGSNPQIFIQSTDPGASAHDGDIWVDTSS